MCTYSYQEFSRTMQVCLPRQRLNSEQEQAVAAPPHPPTFIVAGPGTGKTTVLVLRTLKLILVDGITPAGIVVTTFTRKAAGELRSRILSWGSSILNYLIQNEPNQSRRDWVRCLDINLIQTGTLDSLSEQVLADCRQPGQIVPATIEGFLAKGLMLRYGLFPNNRFRDPDLEALLSQLGLISARNSKLGDKLRGIMSIADRARHDEINLQSYAATDRGHQVLCEAINDYLSYLEKNHMADFGRLESLILERLRQKYLNPVVGQLRALLIDEFQDTNYLQEQIYLELCRQSGASLTVVGDDDQSIFRFRGATVEIFANFQKRIITALGQQWSPMCLNLYRNYRSTGHIVQFCQHFLDMDRHYQTARVRGKRPLVACATHATDPSRNVPILGMFRDNLPTLASDLTSFLWDVFRGSGRRIRCRDTEYTIMRASGGDFGDSVLLAHSVRERAGDRARLPLLLRQKLEQRKIKTFNPRGRALSDIPEVQQLLGLALDCIDPGSRSLKNIQTMTREDRSTLIDWVNAGRQFAAENPPPGGLRTFVENWQTRRVGPASNMSDWPSEWPLLELIFTLTTWFPRFQSDPEGQVYLEAITRTIAEGAKMSNYGGRLVFGPDHEMSSIREAIRTVFEPLAQGAIEIDEEIMPYVPRSYFPIMTIHQAKGLEFPLVIVDVGSDYTRDHPSQRRFRAPEEGDVVHRIEHDVADHCPIGLLRVGRSDRDRAWDDLLRLYFVAYSRAENVLLLVGLTTVIRHQNRIPCIATGTMRDTRQGLNFVPAEEWSPLDSPGTVALI